MLKLFSLILLRNWRSLAILFSVIFLAGSGFLIMSQLTANIEEAVSRETRPLFGGDIRVSPRNYDPIPIIDQVSPTLSGITYSYGEISEFSTTLFDKEGKTGLVEVIAYDGEYPQKGLLRTSPEARSGGYVAATARLKELFSLSGVITLDGREIAITHEIIESSDLGFSFGTENHLIILPRSLLSGSLLISSGSRLDQDLLLSFPESGDIDRAYALLKGDASLSGMRITSYEERSERTIDTAEELSDYILLILIVASVFALIIMRSAHDRLFSDLARTLRIVEILGFSRKRQFLVFALMYVLFIPLASLLALVVSYGAITFISTFEEAREFVFLGEPIIFSSIVLNIILFSAFSPAWILRFGWTLPRWRILDRYLSRESFSLETSLPLFLGIFLLFFLILGDLVRSILFLSASIFVLALLSFLFQKLFIRITLSLEKYRYSYFSLFDGVRTLGKPLVPSSAITISLLGITSFFLLFSFFSFSFRERLILDIGDSPNIYAIDILPEDRESITPLVSSGSLYAIMRARISSINGRTLAEHLGVENPSGEFTREFNISTDTIESEIVRGVDRKLWADEVSVDEDFAERLGVDVGDRIEFLLSGRSFDLTVASIRKSERHGFTPFFYFLFQDEAFRNAPKTYFLTASVTDREAWKKSLIERSGSHVTFVDIENILAIAREIALKILSVIGLFFGSIALFGVLAILTLFSRFTPLDRQKRRLYSLFGMSETSITKSLFTTRWAIMVIAFAVSLLLSVLIYAFMLQSSAFLSLSMSNLLVTIAIALIFYAAFLLYLRKSI